jgi:hypothetical protein
MTTMRFGWLGSTGRISNRSRASPRSTSFVDRASRLEASPFRGPHPLRLPLEILELRNVHPASTFEADSNQLLTAQLRESRRNGSGI